MPFSFVGYGDTYLFTILLGNDIWAMWIYFKVTKRNTRTNLLLPFFFFCFQLGWTCGWTRWWSWCSGPSQWIHSPIRCLCSLFYYWTLVFFIFYFLFDDLYILTPYYYFDIVLNRPLGRPRSIAPTDIIRALERKTHGTISRDQQVMYAT